MVEKIVHNPHGATVTFRLGEIRELNSHLPRPDGKGVLYPVGTAVTLVDLGASGEPWDAERVTVELPDGTRAEMGPQGLMTVAEIYAEEDE